MNIPDTWVPLSVRRGIRSREDWERGQQEMHDNPNEHPEVRVALRKILNARDATRMQDPQ